MSTPLDITDSVHALANGAPATNGQLPRTAVLEARKLSVGYGPNPVVRDLDLVVGAGEIVALLGVNGAGKTTTVRALAGELRPISGEVCPDRLTTGDTSEVSWLLPGP